jgi:excisionase family DNA binding protein
MSTYDAILQQLDAILDKLDRLADQPAKVQPVLFSVSEAGIYLGRSAQSVQHLISEKTIPVVKVGRRVHLHRVDLDRWIEKNKY